MNRAVLASDLYHRWIYFGTTTSNSATWGFDRFRLYYPADFTVVGLYTQSVAESNGITLPNGQILISVPPDLGYQVFTSNNQYQHDFTFDLSWNTNNDLVYMAISGVKPTAGFQQIYCYPTGYSATRGLNAQIASWDFSVVNPVDNIGGSDSSMFFNNQSSLGILGFMPEWRDTTTTPTFHALDIKFTNTGMTGDMIDNVIIWTERGGRSNGFLNYNGCGTPTSASRAAYDNLIARGWSVTGTAPPQP